MVTNLTFPNAQSQGFDETRLRYAVDLVLKGCSGSERTRSYPGAVLLVMRNGVEVVHEACGFCSYDEGAQAMRKDIVFDVASMSKPIATTSAILRLMEMGEVNLEDPIARYMPSFDRATWGQITLTHLLTHTSGLPGWIPIYARAEDRDDCERFVRNLSPVEAVGLRVEYSCMGFMVLGLLVETITSESLNMFVRREIFDKLGMNDTGYYTAEEFVPRERVAPTERRNSCERGRELWAWIHKTGQFLDLHSNDSVAWGAVHDENALAIGGVSGNAGLFSTAADIAKFAHMYLRDGRGDNGLILSPAAIGLATRNFTPGIGDNRGLGWQLKGPNTSFGSLMSEKAYGHTGFTGTALWIDPEYDLVVVFLTNRVHETRENEALLDLRPRLLNAIIASISN
jgi:CubicO group peptidase (beta-lactamase class C family)